MCIALAATTTPRYNQFWYSCSDRSDLFLLLAQHFYSSVFPVDLYSSVLANDLQDDLVVQSWRNGAGGKLSADCDSKYTVTHVDSVRLAFDEFRSITFNTTEDHSKWAIAIDKPIFCFASMNRMVSVQRHPVNHFHNITQDV